MSEEHPPRGKHAIVDVCHCDPAILNDPADLEEIMHEEIEEGGATILEVAIRQFDPQGCTLAFVLAESHATIHTYPECGSYMMDIFTCGDAIDPEQIAIRIAQRVGGEYSANTIERGIALPAV